MNKELEALKTISEIGLSHLEYNVDENSDGEMEYTEYEEDDGTIKENYPQEIRTIKSALERKEKLEKVWEIVKLNPELVWWVCCYENAYEMIIDRKSFMLDYDMKEIERQFNIVKEMLGEK